MLLPMLHYPAIPMLPMLHYPAISKVHYNILVLEYSTTYRSLHIASVSDGSTYIKKIFMVNVKRLQGRVWP